MPETLRMSLTIPESAFPGGVGTVELVRGGQAGTVTHDGAGALVNDAGGSMNFQTRGALVQDGAGRLSNDTTGTVT